MLISIWKNDKLTSVNCWLGAKVDINNTGILLNDNIHICFGSDPDEITIEPYKEAI